jgi:hypothetical protein
MNQNQLDRLKEGLSILKDALKMDDATRLREFGTKSIEIIIGQMEITLNEVEPK